jgi:hypothetical protein
MSEDVYQELESLAEVEARPISNMAYYIILQALNKAKKDGVIQPYIDPKAKKSN